MSTGGCFYIIESANGKSELGIVFFKETNNCYIYSIEEVRDNLCGNKTCLSFLSILSLTTRFYRGNKT